MCERCHLLEAQLAENQTALQGRELQLHRAGQVEVGLRNELTKVREESPDAEMITAILVHWRTELRGDKRAAINLTGKRAGVVRTALKSYTRGKQEERVQACMEAISGLALRPYVGVKGGRVPTGTPDRRFDDIEYALGSEKRIEDHRSYWQRAQASDVQRKLEAWQQITQVADRHFELWMQATMAQDRERVQQSLVAASDVGRPQLVLLEGGELAA